MLAEDWSAPSKPSRESIVAWMLSESYTEEEVERHMAIVDVYDKRAPKPSKVGKEETNLFNMGNLQP